ncbi:MAG: DUF72 domain-containing protein [Dehalococcoidia bacterium]|nr:DUF72 domain-containing protein [Dehalococcoidia bacterium]
MEFRIGCSGWSYAHWRGSFYPHHLSASKWLEYYAARFDTVELNTTFYRLPSEAAVRGWVERTPAGFSFAVKASRYVTHVLRLRGPDEALVRFFGRIEPLSARGGPVLYQTPPTLERDLEVLRRFLALLPPERLHAFEFRHENWWTESVFALLRARGAAFVLFDMGERRTPLLGTAPEVYVRLHGPEERFASAYGEERLRAWLARLRGIEGVRRACVYFNNDVGGHAPADAALMKRLAAEGPADVR